MTFLSAIRGKYNRALRIWIGICGVVSSLTALFAISGDGARGLRRFGVIGMILCSSANLLLLYLHRDPTPNTTDSRGAAQ